MNNVRNQVLLGLVAGVLLLVPTYYLDELFFFIVLAGPPIVGAIAASMGVRWAPVVAMWVSFGLSMLVLDWVKNQEDRIFHVVLTIVMALLAMVGYGVVRLLGRSRAQTPSTADPAGRK